MKTFLNKIFTTFVFCAALISCESSDMHNKEALIGDWHYSGTENNVTVDVWISFSADDTFEMYQMVGEGAYWKSTGSYKADSSTGVISGKYSDQAPWAHEYKFTVGGSALTLTALDTPSYETKYQRETVPAEVKAKALDLTKSGTESFVPYL